MEPVRSPRNRRVAAAARLRRARERALTGQSILEGPLLLRAALEAGVSPSVVFIHEDDASSAELAGGAGCDVLLVSQSVLDRLAPSQHPRGPVAVFDIPRSRSYDGSPLVVLWDVADPGNAGTLIRSAAAFGFGVMVTDQSVDVWSPKVLRAAAGAHFAVPIHQTQHPIEDVRTLGLTPVATVVSGGRAPAVLRDMPRLALIVGSEPHGLPEEAVTSCDVRVTIPMAATESLNVAVAGAILMYEASFSVESGPGSAD